MSHAQQKTQSRQNDPERSQVLVSAYEGLRAAIVALRKGVKENNVLICDKKVVKKTKSKS